jgi:hypothetical protein
MPLALNIPHADPFYDDHGSSPNNVVIGDYYKSWRRNALGKKPPWGSRSKLWRTIVEQCILLRLPRVQSDDRENFCVSLVDTVYVISAGD